MQRTGSIVLVSLTAIACGGESSSTATTDTPNDPGGQLTDAGDATDLAAATTQAAAKPKVDFLWVIDHGPSMCQEQVQLAAAFAGFAEKLGPAVDAQMAVVTVQQVPDIGPDAIVKKVGQFLHAPAKDHPPNCTERTRIPCANDTQCIVKVDQKVPVQTCASLCPQTGDGTWQNPNGGGDWKCKTLSDPKFVFNDNCSINSYCQRRCTNDQQCRDVFEKGVPKEKQRIKCYSPGGSVAEAFCQFPPATEGCPPPDKLPAVLKRSEKFCKPGGNGFVKLDGQPCSDAEKQQSEAGVLSELDWFRCLASVGASQTSQSKFEGAFRSAWYALDPGSDGKKGGVVVSGPNCARDAKTGEIVKGQCQYQDLVRPDAWLVLVFASDDDECSVDLKVPLENATTAQANQLKQQVPSELWDSCGKFPDADASNADLVAGQCEYRKFKNPKITCPSDCAALPPGTQQKADCDAAAAQALEESKKQLFESLKQFGATTTLFSPPAEYVARFQSLKADPGKVVVAVVMGDSTAPEPKQKSCDRVSFYRSLFRNIAPGQAPYICAGKRGEAGYGARYLQLAQGFGSKGLAYNLCADAGLEPIMDQLAVAVLGFAK